MSLVASGAAGASNSSVPPLVKLPFTVTSASSFDVGYESHQLEQQATHTKGWQSARFPSYPQVLILQFPGVYDIRKIQILSHQSKIASSIELYVGREDPSSGLLFLRLGYLSLDPNERSQFKARELKSVYVSARGSHLKLVIKKCHKNAINLFDQVGIIAINVVGNKPNDGDKDPNVELQMQNGMGMLAGSPTNAGGNGNGSNGAGYNTSDSQGLDPVTAAKIRELQVKKREAIEKEDFDEAKRIKQVLDGLNRVSAEIINLERKKRQAVMEEDFDMAKQCKKQIEALRARAVGGAAAGAAAGSSDSVSYSSQSSKAAAASAHDDSAFSDPDDRPIRQPGRNAAPVQEYINPDDRPIGGGKGNMGMGMGGFGNDDLPVGGGGKRKKGQPKELEEFPSPAAEDRPLPASKKKAGKAKPQAEMKSPSAADHDDEPAMAMNNSVYLEDPNDSRALNIGRGTFPSEEAPAESDGNLPPPEPLSNANRKDAESLLEIWEEDWIASLYSKNWNLRAYALKQIDESLASPNPRGIDSRTIFMQVINKVLKRSLMDKVAQVFLNSCTLLESVVRELGSQIKGDEVRPLLEGNISLLMDKLSASNARERDAALQALLFISFHKLGVPGAVVMAALAPPKKKEKDAPLPLKGRARLLLKLLLKFGVNDPLGISVSALMRFVMPQLAHRDATVRDAMFNLGACVAQIAGKAKVEPFLKELRGSILTSFQARMADINEGRVTFTPPEGGRIESASVNSIIPPAQEQPEPPAPKPAAAKKAAAKPAAAASAEKPAPAKKAAAPAKGKAALPSPKPAEKAEKPEKPAAQKKAAAAPAPKATPMPPAEYLAPEEDAPPTERNEISVSTQFAPRGGAGPLQPAADPAEDSFSDFSGKCQFCGLEDPTFTDEKLDLHYWQDCPMLTQCKFCEQVIEIPTLTDHLLQECEAEIKHLKCDRCGEGIPEPQFQQHQQANSCRRALPLSIASRCPLCHLDIGAGEEGWSQHLLVQGCTQNPRKLP